MRLHPFTMITGIALLSAMLFSFVTSAQSTDTLDEVNIKSNRRRVSNDERINTFSPGQKVRTIDSLTLQQYQFQSIANLLSQQVPVFVKSYGFNSLATLNFRGASAAQSQVYWNGVPLQNAALGITDVSLLRTSSFSKVDIVYGGSSALWGSGNVGGALLLENDGPYFIARQAINTSISFMAGSYGQYQFGLQSALSAKRWHVTTNVAAQTARNNFDYVYNGVTYSTANSSIKGASAQVQASYKANSKNTFGINVWAQNYYREIPKATFETGSVKNQEDISLRILGNWKRQTDKLTLYSRLAFMQDYMHYRDSSLLLNKENSTHQVYAEAGARYKFNEHHYFTVFVPLHYSWFESPYGTGTRTQNRLAAAAAYVLSAYHNRLRIAVHGRLRLVNDKSVPLSGLNISYTLTQWLSVRSNVQRSFRLPTLNELYYEPGGNPNLKPEQGWSVDGGYVVKTATGKKLVLTHDVSVFTRRINDWIIWFGGAIWTPHNIAQVHSRGIETENTLQYKLNASWKLHIGINTAYVLATTEASYIPGDGSIGKQIPYSPRYNGQANAGFSFKQLYFNYNHTYTGYRFITVDESSWLMPYNTGNIQLMYTTRLGRNKFQLSAQANNVWSSEYSIISARPMPGINWMAGVKLML